MKVGYQVETINLPHAIIPKNDNENAFHHLATDTPLQRRTNIDYSKRWFSPVTNYFYSYHPLVLLTKQTPSAHFCRPLSDPHETLDIVGGRGETPDNVQE